MATVEQKVKKVVCSVLSIQEEQITPESRFMEDLGADSLYIVEIAMELEDEFGLDIPGEDLEKMKTFGAAVKYMERKADGR